jgi:hypothetical protein
MTTLEHGDSQVAATCEPPVAQPTACQSQVMRWNDSLASGRIQLADDEGLSSRDTADQSCLSTFEAIGTRSQSSPPLSAKIATDNDLISPCRSNALENDAGSG